MTGMTDMQDNERLPQLPAGVAAVLGQRETWATPPPELEGEVLAALWRERDASSAPPAAGDEVAAARRRRVSLRTRVLAVAAAVALIAAGAGIYAARDRSHQTVVALAPTHLAPYASGHAELRNTPSGFAIRLDVSGLPPAAPGTYYQGWLKNGAGDLVTIGSFHGRRGSDNITLWSGVDPRDYPTITVTLQREGAGPASSGQVVLKGTVGR